MATANNTLQRLLTEHDVARITLMSVASVRRWRLLGIGPKYLKIGAAVRYRPKDLTAYIEGCPAFGGGSSKEPK
jgi:Helix-turn-helix domain